MARQRVPFVTAFLGSKRSGGEYVTLLITQRLKDSIYVYARSSDAVRKIFARLVGLILFPYLHPIFTAAASAGLRPAAVGGGPVVLNFSQTFAVAMLNRRSVLVAHDVMLQRYRRSRLRGWIYRSERMLMRRAAKVYVLVEKDRRLVRRMYGITHCETLDWISLAPTATTCATTFKPVVSRAAPLTLLALGNWKRDDNISGLRWFYDQVAPKVQARGPRFKMLIVGEAAEGMALLFPEAKVLGFADDLSALFASVDALCAPILTGAGIKIKVVDALTMNCPVIGTRKALEGIGPGIGRYQFSDAETFVMALEAVPDCDRSRLRNDLTAQVRGAHVECLLADD